MTGPENYAEAGRLLTGGLDCTCPRSDCEHAAVILARAQVHATLALAAATALNDSCGGMGNLDYEAWHEVASVIVKAQVTS
jgi:hypothetical protein